MTDVRVRPPAVAGMFYPEPPDELTARIDADLAAARAKLAASGTPIDRVQPKALIVPHAGYVYSGPIAANGYVRLEPWASRITRVVLLGPAHRVAVRSMALSSAVSWLTPLGAVAIDTEAQDRLLARSTVEVDDRAHGPEHSLEVHLPFLQRILGPDLRLLPIVVGAAADDDIADVLDEVWGGDETLIVISTDLSHYHDTVAARHLDRATAAAIVLNQPERIDTSDACGAHPVRGLLTAARRHRLAIELIDLRNSGDTAGAEDRVVGYGAFVLTAPPAPDPVESSAALTPAEQQLLLEAATDAIRDRFAGREPRASDPSALTPRLRDLGAAFVTLRDGPRLLGCIGSLEPRRSLVDDVIDNAVGAGWRDPRMPALAVAEFETMSLHISVLTPAVDVAVSSRAELLATLRPGIDGLVIEAGRHRATFLPAVWEQLPDPDAFLVHLWRKAGLAPGTWPTGMHVARYETIEFGDDGPRDPIEPLEPG